MQGLTILEVLLELYQRLWLERGRSPDDEEKPRAGGILEARQSEQGLRKGFSLKEEKVPGRPKVTPA